MSEGKTTKATPNSASWTLEGHDTFSNEDYPLEGTYPSESAAQEAAKVRLAKNERTQPTKDSGGQSENGIQDRVFIVGPDGSRYRYVPSGDSDLYTLGREEKKRAIPRSGFRVVAIDRSKPPGEALHIVGDYATREEAAAALAQKKNESASHEFFIYTPDTQ